MMSDVMESGATSFTVEVIMGMRATPTTTEMRRPMRTAINMEVF